MCLAVPMQVKEVNPDETGIVEADGITYEVNLSLIDDPRKDEYVIVHAGFAIEKLDSEEADIRIKMFRELAETEQPENSA